MRRGVAVLVLLTVLGWSVLVFSAERSPSEMMSYADVLDEYGPFKALGLEPAAAWKVVARSIPPVAGLTVERPAAACQLVEVFLHSRGLAACGHGAEHETVGTPCSFSKGTALFDLYARMVEALHGQGLLDARATLYLLEGEPKGWGAGEPHLWFEGRILSADVRVTDRDVEERRGQLVAEGYQTAAFWSAEELRRSLLRAQRGETLEDVDRRLGVGRGEVMRVFVNFVVRPVYLLQQAPAAAYGGRLLLLPRFVADNLAAPQAAAPALAPVEAAALPEEAPRPAAAAAPTVTPGAAPRFATAYGGSRFGMGFGRR